MNRPKRKAQAAPSKSITTTVKPSGGRPSAKTAAEIMINTDQTRSAKATLRRTLLTTQTKKLHAAELAKATAASCQTGINGSIANHLRQGPQLQSPQRDAR